MENIPVCFESQRVVLIAPNLKHVTKLHAAIEESYDDLRVWFTWAQCVPSLAEWTEKAKIAIKAFKEGTDLQYYIFLKDDNTTLIGCCGLHQIDWTVPKFEIGYWIRTFYQRQGYATEIADLLTKVAFERLNANRVGLRCDDNNLKSKLVAQKVFFYARRNSSK